MKKSILLNTTFAIALGICPMAFASVTQSAGQDVKKAGQAVEHGAVKAGQTVKNGARKVVHKSSNGVDKGANRVKSKTKL